MVFSGVQFNGVQWCSVVFSGVFSDVMYARHRLLRPQNTRVRPASDSPSGIHGAETKTAIASLAFVMDEHVALSRSGRDACSGVWLVKRHTERNKRKENII
ncbi:hypothetical protein ACOMHN_027558 [Nucella lapillus]